MVDRQLGNHVASAYAPTLAQAFAATTLTANVEAGLAMTYNAMLAFKKYKNRPVVISRNGQVVQVPAEEMPPADAAPGVVAT